MKKRIIAILFTSIFAVGLMGSCKKPTENSSGNDEQKNLETLLIDEKGESDYKILLPTSCPESTETAAAELNYLLNECYGKTLEIVRDSNGANTQGKYISIGDTSLAATHLKTTYDELGIDGFKIKTVDNSILIDAYGERGVVYGVYGFAERAFGYEYIADDQMYFESQGKSVNVPVFDVTDVPSFAFRKLDWYNVRITFDGQTAARFRLNGAGSTMTEKYGESSVWSSLSDHTTMIILPKDKYFRDHRDWYGEGATDGQLCLTNNEMYAEFLKNLKAIIEKESTKDIFNIGQEDGNAYTCACKNCVAEAEKYTVSGYWLRFINRLADDIKAWLQAEYPERAEKVKLSMFAYQHTENPPTKFDSTLRKDIVVNDEDGKPIRAHDNVMIYYAPIYLDVYHSITDMDHNESYAKALEGWDQVVGDFAVWLYGASSIRMQLVDNYSFMAENLRTLKEYGCTHVNYAGAFQSDGTPFYDLQVYLITKLLWNVEQDVNALIDRFFKVYYKGVSDEMLDYFNTIRSHWVKTEAEFNAEGKQLKMIIPNFNAGKITIAQLRERYPQKFLELLYEKITTVLAKVQAMPDSNEKELLYKRVLAETLPSRFFRIELYPSTFDADTEIETWRNDAVAVGCYWPTLGWDIDALYAEWKTGNYQAYLDYNT